MQSSTCPECKTTFYGRPNKVYCHPRCRQRAFQRSQPSLTSSRTLPQASAALYELEQLRVEALRLENEEAERKRQYEREQSERQRQALLQQLREREARQAAQLWAEFKRDQYAERMAKEEAKTREAPQQNPASEAPDELNDSSGSWWPWLLGGVGLLALANSGESRK